jgi:hypothetical protein
MTYTDFSREIIHSGPNVNGARSIEAGLAAAQGTNRLLVFSGIANVGLCGGAANQLLRGRVEIVLDALTVPGGTTFVDLDMSSADVVEFIAGNAYAGLAGFLNSGRDVQTTYAIDCVSIGPAFRTLKGVQRFVPVIKMAVATAGAGSGGITMLARIAYQANIQAKVGLLFEVGGLAGGFGASVTVRAGDSWLGRIQVPVPSPSGWPVTLSSAADAAHQAFVPLQPTHPPIPSPPSPAILPGQTELLFTSAPTLKFSAPPAEVSVPIVATLNGFTSTAVVNVRGL